MYLTALPQAVKIKPGTFPWDGEYDQTSFVCVCACRDVHQTSIMINGSNTTRLCLCYTYSISMIMSCMIIFITISCNRYMLIIWFHSIVDSAKTDVLRRSDSPGESSKRLGKI